MTAQLLTTASGSERRRLRYNYSRNGRERKGQQDEERERGQVNEERVGGRRAWGGREDRGTRKSVGEGQGSVRGGAEDGRRDRRRGVCVCNIDSGLIQVKWYA